MTVDQLMFALNDMDDAYIHAYAEKKTGQKKELADRRGGRVPGFGADLYSGDHPLLRPLADGRSVSPRY